MNSIKKKNIVSIILYMLLMLFTIVYFYKNNVINGNIKYFILLAFIVVELLMFIIVRKYKDKLSIEKLFLLLIIPFSIMYMVFIPIGRVPDEGGHLYRAYEISNGHLVSDLDEKNQGGRNTPIEYIELFDTKYDRISYKDEIDDIQSERNTEMYFSVFANTSLYSFVCYLPQTIGIFIGRVLNLKPLFVAYMGRFTNIAINISIIYLAIKLIPKKKELLLFISLMPMFLQELISLSPDGFTNALSMLLLSLVLYFRNRDKLISNKEVALLGLVCMILSQCKIVYIPLCLSIFMIPYTKFGNKKNKYLKIGLVLLLTVSLNIIWLSISSKYLMEFNEGVNSSEQLKYILTNPLNYIVAILRTIKMYYSLLIKNVIGGSLCYFDVNISTIWIAIYYFIIFMTSIFDDEKIEKINIFLILFIVLSIVGLIFTSLYIQWNPYQNTFVDGVQGRYFIPLLAYLLYIININKKKIINVKKKYLYDAFISIIIFINIYVCIALFMAHL